MDQAKDQSEEDKMMELHIDQAIERHLCTSLALSSSASASSMILITTTQDEPADEINKNELERIQSSTAYANLLHDLILNPPREKLQKKKPKMESFSLFNMMLSSGSNSGSSLALPANIRDILELGLDCNDIGNGIGNDNDNDNAKECLSRCYKTTVQDLILGFNTTQAEVLQLSNLLHDHLLVATTQCQCQCQDSCTETTQSFLSLHTKWIEECAKEQDCNCFAFLLARNVILVSSHSSLSCEQRFGIVHSLTKIMQCLMGAWNDTASFQTSWLEIMYLWMRCSFQRRGGIGGMDETETEIETSTHAAWAWAYYDAQGDLFARCVSCINSTLMIRILVQKTHVVSYLMGVLTNGLHSLCSNRRLGMARNGSIFWNAQVYHCIRIGERTNSGASLRRHCGLLGRDLGILVVGGLPTNHV